jgi:hypothetical protein
MMPGSGGGAEGRIGSGGECFCSMQFLASIDRGGRCHPIFFHWDVCTLLEWELSWDTKSLLTTSTENDGNMFNYSLQQNN